MTPTRMRSKVLSMSGSELSETRQIRQSEDGNICRFGRRSSAQPCPQLGRSRPRVCLRFRLGRSNHRLADPFEGRCTFVRDRQMTRARSLAGTIGEERLDDPVLERMEGNNDETPAGLQHMLGGKQRLRQFAK